ncbi:MAG: type II toxin-antitoxin system RelE/ParE family toxin [bacterium]|nr:type II toxin-antitoxin system RelE/ParE family toxin [bacterium]
MPTKVRIRPECQKDIKYLARKYPAITDEISHLVVQLENDERPGDIIPNSGYEIYKVRLKNPSSQRGKRGGFRVIYYVHLVDSISLLTAYSKSDQEDVSLHRLQAIIADMVADEDSPDEE